jgi:hypothetical protein
MRAYVAAIRQVLISCRCLSSPATAGRAWQTLPIAMGEPL